MHIHLDKAAELILLLMITIVFLQSGIDKIIEWKGNLSWLKEHFSKTPFNNVVPSLLGVITIFEVVTGLLSIAGFVHILLYNTTTIGFYAALLASLTLLMLLVGQRIAKDYDGAKTIVIHLIATSFLVFLLQ
ncbi:hypothetical protein GCM10011414_05200 [Croceivirga lutea]|uniref:DoxX family protein n=1 Tax=Croceivirga lutea TaxID=1775167 RepID=UPI00163B369C|nr:DoxX family protein [Croceivirga lutea]GGG38863.1 hypothetical protein GCM10011414_05200 [Croceivirga lutea]